MKYAIRITMITILVVQMLAITGGQVSAQSNRRLSTDSQTRQILSRINTRKNAFRQSVDFALNRGRFDTEQAREVRESLREFDVELQEFRRLYNQRNATEMDLVELLNHAAQIDQIMRAERLGVRPERDWNILRTDMELLARRHSVSWNWSDAGTLPPGQFESELTGTYRLDPSRSDNPATVASQASRGLPANQRDRVNRIINRRLQSPEMLAFEQRGRTITMASNLGRPASLEADGIVRTEQTPRGRTIRVTSSLIGDRLMVTTTGDRGNDYRVTFEPVDNGRGLRVTRQLDIEGLTRPITVYSTYNKESNVARLDLRDESRIRGSRRQLMVPNGTQLVAVLNNSVSTRQSREGDRVTLTVESPSEYRGAVIEGYIGTVGASGRLTGRPELGFNFERIRLRNGATHDFEGYIESVRTPTGDTIRVDNEGVVEERDGQTERTITRTGIGAAIGALIGAIAGGGKGAAIGAAVGAGAGAGSVFVEGRDNLELPSGTELTIRSSSSRSQQISGS